MFSKIIIHKVGNKINQENLLLSSKEPNLDEETKELLNDFFLKGFKSEEQFQFYSDTYLTDNPVFAAAEKIFENPENFVDQSQKIAQKLYDSAENPRVQGGELFVCYFEGEPFEDAQGESKRIDQIGIFKTENKNPFLKISLNKDGNLIDGNKTVTLSEVEESFEIEKDYGIGLSKLDKGALIYNNFKETGYAVSAFDNNKNGDEYYWFEDFLKIQQRENDYFQTQETLQVYKDYITKQLPQEFEVSKADQADFLNKSINFFKEKEQFDYDEFTKEILQDESVIESFTNYKTDYEQEMQVSISEEFPINTAAVKKNQKYFKSIIKLDKNFHIYVHGDRKMIDTGQDEKGKFYRLYFEKED